MLDIIGAVTLTSIAFLVVGALVVGAARNGAATARLAWGAAIWFLAIVCLAAAGVFSTRGIGTPVTGAVVLVPVVAGLIAFEKLIPSRRVATYGTAGLLLVLGVLMLVAPDVIPALMVPGGGSMSQMNEMSP